METFCLPNAETDICEDYVELFYDLSWVGFHTWFSPQNYSTYCILYGYGCKQITMTYVTFFTFQPFVKKLDEFAEAISEDARCLLSHVCSSSVTSHSSLIMCGKRTSLDLGLNPELIKKVSSLQ